MSTTRRDLLTALGAVFATSALSTYGGITALQDLAPAEHRPAAAPPRGAGLELLDACGGHVASVTTWLAREWAGDRWRYVFLWPAGTLPAGSTVAAVRWRGHTERFLPFVVHEGDSLRVAWTPSRPERFGRPA